MGSHLKTINVTASRKRLFELKRYRKWIIKVCLKMDHQINWLTPLRKKHSKYRFSKVAHKLKALQNSKDQMNWIVQSLFTINWAWEVRKLILMGRLQSIQILVNPFYGLREHLKNNKSIQQKKEVEIQLFKSLKPNFQV